MARDDLAARLAIALDRSDDVALASVLEPDVRLVVDTGGTSGGTVHGRSRVARALRGVIAEHPDAALETVQVNGGAGLALRLPDGTVASVLVFDRGPDGAIGELWLCAAPAKLGHWNRGRRGQARGDGS